MYSLLWGWVWILRVVVSHEYDPLFVLQECVPNLRPPTLGDAILTRLKGNGTSGWLTRLGDLFLDMQGAVCTTQL